MTSGGMEEDFGALLAEFEGKAKRPGERRPTVGDTVKGSIVSIGRESVFVDLGGKAEGMLEKAQVVDGDGNVTVKVGDQLEARVVGDEGGVFTLRVKLGRGVQAKQELVMAFETGLPVEGVVSDIVKGGLSVQVAGVRAFCPASQIDARFVQDLAPFVGQRFNFRITKYDGRDLVLSRRVIVEEENKIKAVETRSRLQPGLVVEGVVTAFKPYGAFVDIGGIEGMLHVSELGYSRVNDPQEVLKLGQTVQCVILKIEPGDRGERISLSLKAMAEDPWNQAAKLLVEGGRLKGTIKRLETFGAFVEIAPGVEGLVHISELGAGRRINHPKEVVTSGQEVEVTVIAVDAEKRRIALSMASTVDGTTEEVREASEQQTVGAAKHLGTFADLLKEKPSAP
ncbi:MAG: 30S ribosomal protein S1 [Myxococcales bacterium]|nr:30S ribosomal protein S1 [Myxococcales bacterium]